MLHCLTQDMQRANALTKEARRGTLPESGYLVAKKKWDFVFSAQKTFSQQGSSMLYLILRMLNKFYKVFSMTFARSKLVVFAHFMANDICRWKSEECHLYVIKLLIVDIDIFRWGMLSLT